MFVRTATRRNKDGRAVRYVQLVRNEWDPVTKSSRMRVVHSFGREDQLDRAAVERLAGSLGRLLGQETAGAMPELAYADSVAFGGTYLLDQLWRRLGIGQIMTAIETQSFTVPKQLSVTVSEQHCHGMPAARGGRALPRGRRCRCDGELR